MKKYITIITILYSVFAFAQKEDIVTPNQSGFSPGQNIEGLVQSSINEPTGKVIFSIPITRLSARTVSHNISIGYNGDLAFETGSQTNKYMSASSVGVGFTLAIPKIVVDNKNTATKHDDTFYLQDGTSNTELHCINRIEPGNLQTGEIIWEFRTKNYLQWKIRYYKGLKEYVNGVLRETTLDYWKITNDDGVDYFYGQTQNTRENLVAWGNWIGNSNKTSEGTRETIIWNLSTIRDQWNNNITFEYEHQEVSMGGVKQTEATYLKKVTSSTGENIRFVYANKGVNEYYEPHREKTEPDAYQERYEKKYLDYVATYDTANQLIYTYDFTYSLLNNSSSSDQKRYLASITQENATGDMLPSQRFEYYTSGNYKGGVKKITYPSGGSVTYDYKKERLFNNTANNFTGTAPNYSGYGIYSIVTKDNYVLQVLRSLNPISDGKYRFKIVRHWWNGTSWKRNTFILPNLIRDPGNNAKLENFESQYGQDFYGFLHRDGRWANIDLFHINADGVTWNHKSYEYIDIGEGNPSFISGNNFIAVGSHYNGKLHTYHWRSQSENWISRTISQGDGQYYYGATNNFVLSLNKKIDFLNTNARDFITDANHEDYYYIHYLDIENNWVSKSWSANADPYIHGIEKASFFYPENSMTAFVADDNPELFLRWDKNYNLLTPENILGTWDDNSPVIPTYTGMFTLIGNFYQRPAKYARFNGIDWKSGNLPDSYGINFAKPSFGEDLMIFQGYRGNGHIGYAQYNPNTNTWITNTAKHRVSSNQDAYSQKLNSVTQGFMVMGNDIYLNSNTSRFSQTSTISGYDNVFIHSDGRDHAFIELESTNSSQSKASRFYHMDKDNNDLNYVSLGALNHLSGPTTFAGRTPFLSNTAMWLKNSSGYTYLYRVVNGSVNNEISNIIVDKVSINNGDGEIRETSFIFESPNTTPDNNTTFYADVTIENKGYGSDSLGKIEKKFNNGATDTQMAGLLLEENVKQGINANSRTTKTTWTKYEGVIARTYVIKPTKQEETIHYQNGVIRSSSESQYNLPDYRLTKVESSDSKGQTLETITQYAHHQYPFMTEPNFVKLPYQIIKKIDENIVSINRTIWTKNSANKIYASETWAGNTEADLRLTSKVTKMNDFGQVIESTNGRGQYNSIVFANNYRYPVLSISNAKYNDVINNLDVSIASLQNLSNSSLKTELSKLYSRLPEAMIEISLYDTQGKVVKKINERQDEINYYYDSFNRLDYTTDINGNVLNKNVYNYGAN